MSAIVSHKKSVLTLLSRHVAALVYVLRVVLPTILRTGRRPVIFSRFSGMGDIICSIPTARELMKRHPGASFIYNCHSGFAEVPKLASITSRVTSFQEIGLVDYWYGFLLGGYYYFSHGDDWADSSCQESMIVEFLKKFGLPVSDAHPQLSAGPAAQERVGRVLKQKGLDSNALVLIHPGPSWPVREWTPEKWGQLVAELRHQGCTQIAQLGVSHYSTMGKVTVPVVPGTVSLLDEFSVEECFAVIARAKLFIGIDSGLLHIAACTRTPSVALFGMTRPEYRFNREFRKDFVVSRVECAGCEHRRPRLHWITGCPHDIQCMKTIEVRELLEKCLIKLAQTNLSTAYGL